MVNLKHIRDLVIEPALHTIDLYSPEAVDLILYTGVQESRYQYLKQLGTGPALSFWQIEPNTLYDIYDNYLEYRPPLKYAVDSLLVKGPAVDQLAWNLRYAAAICRLQYRRSPLPLPKVGDGPGMAHIWKVAYNTHLGDGTEDQFLMNWENYKGEIV